MGNSLLSRQKEADKHLIKHFGCSSIEKATILPGKPAIKATHDIQTNPQIQVKPYKIKKPTHEMIRQFGILNPSYNVCPLSDPPPDFIQYTFSSESHQKQIAFRRYFETKQDRDRYVCNILRLKQLSCLKLFNQLNEGLQNQDLYVELVLSHEWSPLEEVNGMSLSLKLEVLQLLCQTMSNVSGLFIRPEWIVVDSSELTIINAEASMCLNKHDVVDRCLVQLFTVWLFDKNCPSFDILLCMESSFIMSKIMSELDIPSVLKYILLRRMNYQISLKEMAEMLEIARVRGPHLNFKLDSLHACLHYRPGSIKQYSRIWIFMKMLNKVYFYHVQDRHPHVCSIQRKKRRILLDQASLVFDQEQCQLIIHHRQKKDHRHLVKASEFELQMQESVSDIGLYQKLPVSLEDAQLYIYGRKLYILDKNFYVLELTKPRVLRELAKQISRYVYLMHCSDSGQIYILQNSKDIYRDGIRLWSKDGQLVLHLAGSEHFVSQVNQHTANLEEVLFCLEIFSNIFIILACNNLLIIDLNYKCFFSYASLEQILHYEENKEARPLSHQFMFQIIGQNFPVTFPKGQNSNNCCIKKGRLHILGLHGSQVVQLIYQLEPLESALRLKSVNSLMYMGAAEQKSNNLLRSTLQPHFQHKFMVDCQEMFIYRYQSWIYKGNNFLTLHDVNITSSRSNYQFIVKCENTLCTLKDEMDRLKAADRYYSKRQCLQIILKCIEIYQEVLNLQVTHRNISTRFIYFTGNKLLKLSCWAEPSRVEFVSDYKDFMLLIYNIMTASQLQKLTSQALESSKDKYQDLEDVYKMASKSIKMPVAKEQRQDIDNNLNKMKESIEKYLCRELIARDSHHQIFYFQINTNIVYFSNIMEPNRLTKAQVTQEDEEFIFHNHYQYVWNQELSVIYILGESLFYSVKYEPDPKRDKTELKLKVEDEEPLPRKIRECTLCLLPLKNIVYCFGGLEVHRSGQRSSISNCVFFFDSMKLTWEERQPLCHTLLGATAVPSKDNKTIFLFGGVSSDLDLTSPELKLIIYKEETGQNHLYVDINKQSPYGNSWLRPVVMLLDYSGSEAFLFYSQNSNKHHITILSLTNGSLSLSFSIDETQQGQAPSDDPPSTKDDNIIVSRKTVSYSCKDKCIYFLDNFNKMLIINFKNIVQPVLQVIQTSQP